MKKSQVKQTLDFKFQYIFNKMYLQFLFNDLLIYRYILVYR